MASGASVKLGVEGISQFKNNMNQAKQAVKTLDAQIALSEKQYKKTGDAESYMTEKTELLKAKLEQQKAVVDNAQKALDDMAERGVDRASKAYQDMYRQMVTAKGALIDTENEMNQIAVTGDEAASGVDVMNQQLKRIGTGINFENVNGALDKISGGMEKAMKTAVNLGKAIVKEVLGAGSWADDLHTRATYFGMTDEELQRAEKTANLIDTSVDSIVSSQKKLRLGLGKEDKEVMGGLVELLGEGYDPRGKDWADVFWDAGEALMKFSDANEKEVYAQKLFGRSWNELIPLFQAGREEYEKLNESWSVVPQEQIDALGKMDDQYQRLNTELETVKMTFLGELAPAVEGVMGTITTLLEKFNEYLRSENGQQMMESLSNAVSGLFEDLANVDPEDVANTVTGILDTVKTSLEWVADHKQDVVNAVKAFILAWGGIKLAGGVTTVLKLVEGIKGLTASSAASAGATAGASWASAFASAAMKAAPFLAFLYTMLKPGDTATDDLDLLWDENGNPTTAGIAAGVGTQAESENGGYYYPEWRRKEDEEKLMQHLNTQFVGDGSDAEARNELRRQNARAMQELGNAADKMNEAAGDLTGDSNARKLSTSELYQAAGEIKGLGGQIESAILRGMSGINIYIDGQSAGNVLTPYVGQNMGNVIMEMFK